MAMVAEDGTVTYTFDAQAVGMTLEVITDAKLKADLDPLQDGYFDVWRWLHERGEHDFGCTCGRLPEARHTETCGVTPIFANMCYAIARPSAIRGPIVGEMLRIVTPKFDEWGEELDDDDG